MVSSKKGTSMTEEYIKRKKSFTRRNLRRLHQLAEATTHQKKLSIINGEPNFHDLMHEFYPEYCNTVKYNIDREQWIKKIDAHREEFENELKSEDGWEKNKEDIKRLKRIEKAHRKISNKMKYRLKANYFDNYLVMDWIFEYNKYGTECYIDLVMRQVDEVVRRQITRLKLHKFGVEMDDLFQDLRAACYGAIPKFDPAKGKKAREAFNYFSLICIKAGRLTTNKHTKRSAREFCDTDLVVETLGLDTDQSDNEKEMIMMMQEQGADLLTKFYDYFHKLFDKRERMQLLLYILIYFILKVAYFDYNRSKFVKFAKSFGFTSAYVNKFIKIIQSHKDDFGEDFFMI